MKKIAIVGSPLLLSTELLKSSQYTKELTKIIDEDESFKFVQQHHQADLTKKQINAPYTEPVRSTPKIQNNEPCICGSGKKYKKCCKLTPKQ